jgi:hypothetical protein
MRKTFLSTTLSLKWGKSIFILNSIHFSDCLFILTLVLKGMAEMFVLFFCILVHKPTGNLTMFLAIARCFGFRNEKHAFVLVLSYKSSSLVGKQQEN